MHLTEPLDLVEGDEAGEGLVDVGPALVAYGQRAEAVEPSMGPLNDPAVTAELLAALDPLAVNTRHDPSCPALVPARLGIVSLVGMQLVGTASGSPASAVAQRREGIERLGHHRAVVPVGPAQADAERRAAGVGDAVALRARLTPVRRVRAGGRPPFWPGRTHCPGSLGSCDVLVHMAEAGLSGIGWDWAAFSLM